MLEEHGRRVLARRLEFISPSALDMEPESNIRAADEVVDAIAIAACGKGWL
uniref:Putative WRKY transcription factor 31 n=1 Tax=Rhizophora mucronata TaxID=61149 RepID=A0A2P2LVX4_RHIMU